MLGPGEQLIVRSGARDRVTLIAATDGDARGDQVQFDDVTLAAAATVMNQGSAVNLVIPDPAVAAMRASGRFKAGDPQRFARNVAELLSLRVAKVSSMRTELRRR